MLLCVWGGRGACLAEAQIGPLSAGSKGAPREPDQREGTPQCARVPPFCAARCAADRRHPTVLTNVIMLTPRASWMVTALVDGSIADALTGTDGTAVHSHSLFTGLLWMLLRERTEVRLWAGGEGSVSACALLRAWG